MAFGPGWTATFVCTLRILTMSVELKGRSVCRMDCPITIEGLEHSAFRLVRTRVLYTNLHGLSSIAFNLSTLLQLHFSRSTAIGEVLHYEISNMRTSDFTESESDPLLSQREPEVYRRYAFT